MENEMNRRLFLKRVGQAGSLLVVGSPLLAACGGNVPTNTENTSGTKAQVESKGLMRAGSLQWGSTADNGAPYVYKDPGTAKLIGFEVEIAAAIAKLMAVTSTQVETNYPQLDQALQAKNFDMIMNGWEITEDRQKTQIFSDAYYKNGQQIVVRANDARFANKTTSDNLSLKDLEGLTVGTGAGFKAEELLLANPKIKTKAYDPDLPFNDLALGRLDAVVIDYSTVTYYALGKGVGGEENKALKLIGRPFEFSDYVVAFNKTSDKATTLQQEINKALGILKQDGTLKTIYEKWGLWTDEQTQIGIK